MQKAYKEDYADMPIIATVSQQSQRLSVTNPLQELYSYELPAPLVAAQLHNAESTCAQQIDGLVLRVVFWQRIGWVLTFLGLL